MRAKTAAGVMVVDSRPGRQDAVNCISSPGSGILNLPFHFALLSTRVNALQDLLG
jgi:hypothetical protein